MQMCVSVFFTFYIILLYIVDISLRWRYTDHAQSYFVLRLFIASLFFGLDIFLIVESKRTLAAFYSLQSLSLLLSFIIQVMMSSRSVLGAFTFDAFRDGPFPWIHSAFVLVVLGLLFPAFAFIFYDSYIDLSRILVVAGCVLGYGFLGCLTIGQLDRSGMLGNQYKKALAPLLISGITLVAMPASVLCLCWHDMAVFLLTQIILSSIVTTSWVFLTLYKLEDRDDNLNRISHIEG
ncbi:14cdaaef-2bd0-4262-8213-899a995f2cd6 [Sclerotinia trifoliorum]|uniref:14cdaaef-2bd0-4262-8213-899a995f2cd6 n=1 Tax=Sclerotinia trifoliorum TaxID=28548 RepID=A0A8H2VZT7_9HELO|nr:14cdaaef-2bd0-4262-8213-899a995f2cd6 [Sclerotinia trifoliorum]